MRIISALPVVLTLVAACAGDEPDEPAGGSGVASITAGTGDGATEGSSGGSTSGAGETSGDGSAGSGEGTTTGDDDSGSTGGVFIGTTGDGQNNECDVWMQDCMDGEKCMPWANDGGNSWNADKCVPVDPNPKQVGDPCTVEGNAVSGIDDCAAGAMCYNVSYETNMGVCHELCGGSEAAPSCDTPQTTCAIYNDGIMPLCLNTCDPLLDQCGEQQLCLGSPDGTTFVCILDSLPNDEGIYGTPCEYVNTCDTGLFCATATNVPGCAGGAGCCSEYCDLQAADPDAACTGAPQGQKCLPWWGQTPAPPGYDHVGFCGIPE